MDNFGFTNQGMNYQKFRPKYPQCLYNHTLDKIKHRNRYLDVAIGTGQLLLNIAPQFAFSKGIDISDKMLEAAEDQLLTQFSSLKQKIQIQKCDILSFQDKQKYDLITVGQALHWFQVPQALQKMKGLLAPGGKLLILSYIVTGTQQQDENEKYKQFYDKVKPYFDFDRDEMHSHYCDSQKYPFGKVFAEVVRFEEQVRIPMSKQVYLNYLKTYSGYNQYLLKNPLEQDPIQAVQTASKSPTTTVVLDYFKIQCGL